MFNALCVDRFFAPRAIYRCATAWLARPALAADVVEYDGQPVAAIAATTLDRARAAAKLAAIDYEPLAPVLTIEEAMARESYVSPPQIMFRGEVEEALACAPHRLFALLPYTEFRRHALIASPQWKIAGQQFIVK